MALFVTMMIIWQDFAVYFNYALHLKTYFLAPQLGKDLILIQTLQKNRKQLFGYTERTFSSNSESSTPK